jgi:hypothetical protein
VVLDLDRRRDVRDPENRFRVRRVRGADPDLASYLRIEERELEAGGQN